MKLYTWPLDICYGFYIISYAIRNFIAECAGMTIDDPFWTVWLLLIVQFVAEVKAFVVAHVIYIDHTIGELLCEHLIFFCGGRGLNLGPCIYYALSYQLSKLTRTMST